MNSALPEPPVRTEQFHVHSYEVDLKKEATLEAICRFFQEIAWNHAEALGVGFEQLASQQRLWVLARLLVQIGRRPRWGETVLVETWPRPAKSIFAMRDFEMRDAAGTTIVAASSAWLILDDATRKPQRPDKWLVALPPLRERGATDRDPEKVPRSKQAEADPTFTTAVRYSDIDVNGHVNNARYVAWLLDAYPTEFHISHSPRLLEINFLGETRGGDTVSVSARQTADGEYSHSIFRSDGREEVCRARLVTAYA